MKNESQTGDPLDRLWQEVINFTPDAEWLTQFTKQKNAASHPIKGVLSSMKKVVAAGVSAEDLSRVGRAERYNSCFNVLYSLEDPGLSDGKLAGLHSLLAKHHPNARSKSPREHEFFQSLWENIDSENDGEFIADEAEEPGNDDPFGDIGPAYKRLLASGIAASDLARIAIWHRYEACFHALRILSECCEHADELAGSNASLLSADPSGKEGRPGSWPYHAGSQPSSTSKAGGSGDGCPVEKFAIKSVSHFEFTPDSRFIVACGSGPIRIFDARDASEVASTLKVKNPLAFEISPDSKQVAATLDSAITISDVQTGVEINRRRLKRPVRLAWTPAGLWVSCLDAERLFDIKALTPVNNPDIQGALEEGASFNFSPNQKFLANVFAGNSTMMIRIRSWPELTPVSEWPISGRVREADSWKWSPDGRFILVVNDEKKIYDAKDGQLVWALDGTEFGPATFSPDGKWLVTGTHSKGMVVIWDVAKRSKARQFAIKAGWCFGLHISGDGKLLGAATHRQCVFWDFSELVS